jgi:hypothetical protein
MNYEFGASFVRLKASLRIAPVIVLSLSQAMADEGGVSFWVPGTFGSLAATPQQPGWSLASIYYYTSVSAGSDVSLAREFRIGQIPSNLSANLNANLNATGGLAWVIPSYVFATPILGGQAAVSLTGIYGRTSTSVVGSLTGTLTTPFGTIPFMRSDSISDSVWGFGDPYPQFSLRWNTGVHNVMTYITGDVPVGAYDSKRLSNLGIGHGAIDAGGGYTCFDQQTGHEFSAVLGFTCNLKNESTQYRNGIDMHLDWGASQFLTEQWQVGVVGYAYDQITGDSGSGDRVGAFESRVFGIGPQIGYVIPLGDHQGYLNLKGYKEFDAKHRPGGVNVWLTLAISPAAATPATPPRGIMK